MTWLDFIPRAAFRRDLLTSRVDPVMVTQRAEELAKRSIKKSSKIEGIKLAISMIDLTTLEGQDSPGKVRQMCQKAIRPLESDPEVPHCAAVCVYPNLVPTAKKALKGTTVKVAAVATSFPSGQSPLDLKLDEVRRTVEMGADEIDMVINRGALLSGRDEEVFEEIVKTKEACGPAHLKVILETGELGTYDNVRRASFLAMFAGADFIKTSTGKLTSSATLPVTLVMLEAIRDFYYETGKRIGMKPAGGIRVSKTALQYLTLVKETLGDDWLTPDMFRLGASVLLNDLLMQYQKEKQGRYQSEDYFSKD